MCDIAMYQNELARIPGVTPGQARALMARLSRELRAADRARAAFERAGIARAAFERVALVRAVEWAVSAPAPAYWGERPAFGVGVPGVALAGFV